MPRRAIAGAAAATTAATAAASVIALARRHRRVATAATELRGPALYVPISFRNRAALRFARQMLARSLPDVVDARTVHVPAAGDRPPVRLLVHEPSQRPPQPTGALVWIHGGGLVMGAPEQSIDLCRRFADELGIVVVSVDYRLAPEQPFPAGLDDCFAALTWLHDHADELGVDPTRVAVGGESAGGGLAACIAQMAHDRGGPAVCFQLLQYPMLDDRTALRRDLEALVWSAGSNRFAWRCYLGHRVSATEPRPYASAARRSDLAALAPAWIGVGAIDLFHDEDVDYAVRLRASGVDCELHVVPGMFHAADHFAAGAPSMRDFRDRMVVALRSAIAPEAPVPTAS